MAYLRQKTKPLTLYQRFCPDLVEMAGIEPASENSSTRFSPSAVIVLGFPRRSAQ